MTKWIFRVAVLSVCFWAAAMPLGAQELRVFCETGGRSLSLAEVDPKGTVLLLDGDKLVPVPKDAVWRLEGDIRSQRAWFAWGPPYKIERSKDSVFFAEVGFDAVPHKSDWNASARVPIRSRWLRTGVATGALITCWVEDGQVRDVKVWGTPNLENGAWSGYIRVGGQQMQGQPAVLLWSEGRIEKPEPLFADPEMESAVLAALIDDDATAIGLALEKQPQLARQVSTSGRLFLNIVAEAGSTRAVKALIGADPKLAKSLPKGQRTPLQDAAAKGREAVVAELLAGKFDKNAKATDTTALIEAATAGHFGTVKLLVEARADVKVETSDHRSAFTQAADRGYVEIVEMLLPRMDADFRNTTDHQGVLRTQASKGHAAMVRWMLGKKVTPNSKLPGLSALGHAALAGHRDTVEALIEGKADVKWADPKNGYTALMLAAGMAHTGCVEALVAAGADVNARNSGNSSALHIAAQADAGEIIELLLAQGVDVDARTASGLSALEIALIGQSGKAVAALEKAGAKIDLKSKYMGPALEGALTMDRDELIARAVADGWSIDTRLKGEWPVIRVAELLGAGKCVTFLAKAGADQSYSGPYPTVRSKELDSFPQLAEVVLPDDPRAAGETFAAQTVVIEAMVAADGSILFPKIVETPEKRLGLAVADVVSAWRLTPITRRGEPVAARLRLPVQFPASSARIWNSKDLDELPQPLSQTRPDYDSASRNMGKEARAVVQFTVSSDGTVRDVRVIEHTGVALAESAVKAVKKWKYIPGKVAGKPVAVRLQIPIIFNLID